MPFKPGQVYVVGGALDVVVAVVLLELDPVAVVLLEVEVVPVLVVAVDVEAVKDVSELKLAEGDVEREDDELEELNDGPSATTLL